MFSIYECIAEGIVKKGDERYRMSEQLQWYFKVLQTLIKRRETTQFYTTQNVAGRFTT